MSKLSASKRFFSYVLVALMLPLLGGCVSPTFRVNVSDPEPSQLRYSETENIQPLLVTIEDSRDVEALFSSGRLNYIVQQDDVDLKEIDYLIRNTLDELKARGIPVSTDSEGSRLSSVDVLALKMLNHRVNAFSPLVSLTSLSADIASADQSSRVVSYVKRGKVPVWSMTEKGVVDNVFDKPLHILVKELASHINRATYNLSASDAYVGKLIERINGRSEESTNAYLDVYDLGYSNNPKAEPALVGYTAEKDEYIRLAALSALGTLKAVNQIALLKRVYFTGKLWQDRAMALKSIGDMGTAETQEFLTLELEKLKKEKGREAKWNSQIIGLYL